MCACVCVLVPHQWAPAEPVWPSAVADVATRWGAPSFLERRSLRLRLLRRSEDCTTGRLAMTTKRFSHAPSPPLQPLPGRVSKACVCVCVIVHVERSIREDLFPPEHGVQCAFFAPWSACTGLRPGVRSSPSLKPATVSDRSLVPSCRACVLGRFTPPKHVLGATYLRLGPLVQRRRAYRSLDLAGVTIVPCCRTFVTG